MSEAPDYGITQSFGEMLRIRREAMAEEEVNFDDDDILAVAMDYLMEQGWEPPPKSRIPR